MSFDPEKSAHDDNEMITALRNTKSPDRKVTEAAMVVERQEIKEAMREMRARKEKFYELSNKEKAAWVEEAMMKAIPMWAMRQVFLHNRGWILYLFGVRLDKIPFYQHGEKTPYEIFELRKRGKPIAVKLFKWDDGQHLEGKV